MRTLFYLYNYQDIHWMNNVIQALKGRSDVGFYTDIPGVEKVCQAFDIPLTQDKVNWQAVVVTNLHMGPRLMAEYFKRTGGKVIVMQHAWDSNLVLRDNFWGKSTDLFDYYCVGSEQDYDWLREKWGDRIVLTGMPRLDDLYRVKSDEKPLTHIYEKLGVDKFMLSISPIDIVFGQMMVDRYYNILPKESSIPIIFKSHPGTSYEGTRQALDERGLQHIHLIPDDPYDILNTYELIKASSGVVCLESFLGVEASLMHKPIVLYGYQELDPSFWGKDENINQRERLPFETSSWFNDLRFKDQQKVFEETFLFDGGNTKRVVDFITSL